MNRYKHTGKGDPPTPNPDKAALLSCPFCGGDPSVFDIGDKYGPENWNITCSGCPCSWDKAFPSEADAIEAWNTRRLRDTVEVDDEAVQKYLYAAERHQDEGRYFAHFYEYAMCAAPSIRAAFTRLKALEGENASLQAKIDALMFEYCPDDMTPEQIAEYEKHQRPVDCPLLNAEQEVGK